MAEGRRLSEEEKKRLAFEKMIQKIKAPASSSDLRVVESGASLDSSSILQENLGSGLAMAATGKQMYDAAKNLRTAKEATEAAKTAKDVGGLSKSANLKLMAAKKGAEMLGIGGENDYSTAGGATSGALEGASMGAMLGPKGAIVGAVIGGAMGALGAGSKRKAAARAAKARAEAQHASNLGRIEQEKDAKIQGAFSRLSQAFASNLRGKKKVTL